MRPTVLVFTFAAFYVNPVWAEETLSLSQALLRLDRNNPSLAEAKSRIEEAQAIVKQTTSVLLPSLSVTGGYTRNSNEATLDLRSLASALSPVGIPNDFPEGVTIQPLDAFTVAGSLRIPLLMPSAFAERKAAKYGTGVWAISAEIVRQRLRGILRQTAWMSQAQEEMVIVTEKAVANAKAHRKYVARAVVVGTQPELSQWKADTEVVKRQSDLVKAQSDLARGRRAIGALLGQETQVRVVVDELSKKSPVIISRTVEEAVNLRPEVRLEDARLDVVRAQILAAKLRWAPQLSASAVWFASTDPYPTGQRTGWRLTVDAEWTMYDGGMRGARLAQANASQKTVAAAKSSRQIQVVQEITDAAQDITVANERLRLAEQQVQFAKAAATSAERLFAAGLLGSLEVLDANDRLYQSEVGLAEARGRLGVAWTNYDLVRGI